MRDSLSRNGHGTVYGPVIALAGIESALGAAKRQQARIAHGKRAAWKPSWPGRRRGTIFDDVHFYVICWARNAKLGGFVAQATRFKRVGLVMRRYHSELREMVELRDHLEHFEERLPGGPKHGRLAVPNDLFNMANDFATFGGRKVDIGRKSLRVLSGLVQELRSVVLYDSAELLENIDVSRLSYYVERAWRDESARRVIRRLNRTLDPSLRGSDEPQS